MWLCWNFYYQRSSFILSSDALFPLYNCIFVPYYYVYILCVNSTLWGETIFMCMSMGGTYVPLPIQPIVHVLERYAKANLTNYNCRLYTNWAYSRSHFQAWRTSGSTTATEEKLYTIKWNISPASQVGCTELIFLETSDLSNGVTNVEKTTCIYKCDQFLVNYQALQSTNGFVNNIDMNRWFLHILWKSHFSIS